ncbi:neuroglian, partial [Exaiptasia diaphana]|uniref:Uncharacterized protein n=1 Tax=Exaiptasia diaphana TaxID=2652724 RepID=A0A913Y4Q1_EXADI
YTRIWNLSVACPSRLRNRLTITDYSSLVIKEATIDDSGTYGCTLNLTNGRALTSRSELIVTETPTITVPRTVVRREGQDLSIKCTSHGKPTPFVKWVRLTAGNKAILYSQGDGSAILSIRNVRREVNGTYECQASNNPDIIVKNQTDVLVQYRPSIDSSTSSPISVSSWDNRTVSLRCMASGNPTPEFTWSNPDKVPIKYGVSPLKGGSLLTIQTKSKTDYGQYRCRASNRQGYVYGYIDVKRIVVPQPPILLDVTSTVSTIEIKWRRPTIDGGSELIDYYVSISTSPPRGVSIKETSLIIAGLAKSTRYRVDVLARNIVGYSNATSRYISTKEKDWFAVDEQISGPVVLGVCLPIIF